MACEGSVVVSHVKHTFLEFEEDGFEAGMCGSRRCRANSDSGIHYGDYSDSDSVCQTSTQDDSGSDSDSDNGSDWASFVTASKTAHGSGSAWSDLDNATSSRVTQEVPLYHSVPAMPPSAMEWESQAAKLRAQAREAEEAAAQLKARLAAALRAQAQEAETKAREAQECFARRANAGNPQSMQLQNAVGATQEYLAMVNVGNLQSGSVQNLPPSVTEFNTHSNGQTSATANQKEAVPTAEVTASVAAPTPQASTPQMTLVPMVQCMPMFPVCISTAFPECAEVSTACEYPTARKQEQGHSQPHCAASTEFTTLMLRNIPNSYTRDMFIKLLDQEGLQGSYDLVFVPVDFTSLAGLGYAFVNFTSNENAETAKEKLQGFASWEITSPKVCEVAWGSALQGLSAHIKHYRNSPVMHKSVPESCKPLLFKGGVPQAFPGPTKQIRAPRVKAYTQ